MTAIMTLIGHGLLDLLMLVMGLWLVVMPVIAIHELGHLLIGKWLGAKPSVFSIGFGKPFLSGNFSGVEVKLCPIPLGGYVKFDSKRFDFMPDEASSQGPRLHPLKWVLISLAGPFANFALSLFIIVGVVFSQIGHIKKSTVIGVRGAEAKKYLLEGTEVYFLDEVPLLQSHLGNKVYDLGALKITGHDFHLIPVAHPKLKPSFLFSEHQPISVVQQTRLTLILGSEVSRVIVDTISENLKLLADRAKGAEQISGIIGIARESKSAMTGGLFQYLVLVFGLSISVGIFNLLPLAFLDGGVAMTSLVEFISRRSVSKKYYVPYAVVSFGLLFCLLSLSVYNDVKGAVAAFFHVGKIGQ